VIAAKVLMAKPPNKLVHRMSTKALVLSDLYKAGLRCNVAIFINHAGRKIKHTLILVLSVMHLDFGFANLGS